VYKKGTGQENHESAKKDMPRRNKREGKYEMTYIHICMPVSCSRTVQQLRAALHQLHQREAAAVLQPPHVCPRTRGIHEGGH